MSRPSNDATAFVLFEPLSAPSGRGADGGFQLKVMPGADPAAARPHAAPHDHGPQNPTAPAQPIVTLQREGDRVTGIRIACLCGQVIELACAY